MQFSKKSFGKIGLFGTILIFLCLMLAACGERPLSPDEQMKAVQEAVAVTGVKPFPTVNPQAIVGFDFFIYGQLFYPLKPEGEVIQTLLVNKGLTTVYISQCEGLVLQQKRDKEWLNIASVRRCGSKPPPYPITAGKQFPLPFEYKKAFAYSGKKYPDWLTYGTHRLAFVFSKDCPSAVPDFNECVNIQFYPSVEFEVKEFGDPTPTPKQN